MKTMPRKTQATTSQGGFTLIETTVASLVMLVGALAVSSLFVFSTQNNVGGGERALAMAVAQQQLEQLRSVTYEDATLNAGTTTSTVQTANRNYTVEKVVAVETNDDNSSKQLKRITVTVTPIVAGADWTRTPVVLVSFRSTLAAGNYAVTN